MFEVIITWIIILICICLAYKEGFKEGYNQWTEDSKEIFTLTNDLVIYVENGRGDSPGAFLKTKEIRREFPNMKTAKERAQSRRQEVLNTKFP